MSRLPGGRTKRPELCTAGTKSKFPSRHWARVRAAQGHADRRVYLCACGWYHVTTLQTDGDGVPLERTWVDVDSLAEKLHKPPRFVIELLLELADQGLVEQDERQREKLGRWRTTEEGEERFGRFLRSFGI